MDLANFDPHRFFHHLHQIEREWIYDHRNHPRFDSYGRQIDAAIHATVGGLVDVYGRVARLRMAMHDAEGEALRMLGHSLPSLNFGTVWHIFKSILRDVALWVGGGAATGGAIGGALGAFAGGVGAVPGAGIGAAIGAQVGNYLMGLFGLGQMAGELAHQLPKALYWFQRGFKCAWGPAPDRRLANAGRGSDPIEAPAYASHYFAQGYVILVIALLTAIVAWVTRNKGGIKELLANIRNNPRLGPEMAQWMAQNERGLLENPKLQSRLPEEPVGGSNEIAPLREKNTRPVDSGINESTANTPPTVASKQPSQPRVDLTDKFAAKKHRNGATELRYGNPDNGHGLIVHVDKDGVLGFDIRAQGDVATLGSGKDMFISAMNRLRQDGVTVNKIRGYWIEGTDSVNSLQFLKNLEIMPVHDAAKNTWTGRIAEEAGFPTIEKVKTTLGNTTAIFGR
jgi:hypothetical protein